MDLVAGAQQERLAVTTPQPRAGWSTYKGHPPPPPPPPTWQPGPGVPQGGPGAWPVPNPFNPHTARPAGLVAPELEGRFGKTLYPNRITLTNRTIFQVTVDRPSVCTPISTLAALVWYQYEKRPTWRTGAGPQAAPESHALRSVGPGNVYLPAPGEWFLYYDTSTAGTVDFLVVPTEDPAFASRFLSEPGCHTATAPLAGFLSGAGGATANVPANRDRKLLIVQNTSGAAAVLRIGIGSAPDVSAAPPLGTGLALQNMGQITFQGEALHKGAIHVGSNAAWSCNFLEFE